MGDRLTEEEQKPKQTSPTPYGDMFDSVLPSYIAIGMPYDLYWDGEFGTKRAFRKAYKIKLEAEQRISDQRNWNMGQYVAAALQAVPLLVAGFNTKGANIPDYPDKPLIEKYEEKKKEDAAKQQQEDQSKLAMAMFQAMASRFNKNMEKKQERSGQ